MQKFEAPNFRIAVFSKIFFTLISILAIHHNLALANSWHQTQTTIGTILEDESIRSTEGRPLTVYSFIKSGSVKGPKFLIQGGLHGNETQTSVFIMWLKKRLESGNSLLNKLPPGSQIDFLPFANPDSYGISRYNVKKINLNRNFGILWGVSKEPNGEHPHSEAETRAIAKLMGKVKYTAAIDVHGYINWIVAPSQPTYLNASNVTKHKKLENRYWKWINALLEESEKLPGYQLKTAGSLGDGGAFEDWAFWQNNTLSFCLELSDAVRHKTHKESYFTRYEQFVSSMLIKASVLDTQGIPIAAHSEFRNPAHSSKAKSSLNSYQIPSINLHHSPSF